MSNAKYLKDVEITCKTFCKTQCNKTAKLCAKLTTIYNICAKPTTFSHFPTTNSQLFAQPPTSGLQLIYPLFHQAYYYNYKLINRKELK